MHLYCSIQVNVMQSECYKVVHSFWLLVIDQALHIQAVSSAEVC